MAELPLENAPGWFIAASKNVDQSVPTGRGSDATIAAAFFDEMDRREERANAFQLGGSITENEWLTARAKQPPIVDQWFYEDVGVLIAPGGTGKTTLFLFQVIHIVLGLDLFGYEVRAPGPVVIVTAEDSRETLIARLRFMCHELNLTEAEKRTIREEVIITDVAGRGMKLTTVEKDVVMPSKQLDRLAVEIGVLHARLVFFDPMVSFGVGESRINDAEQGLIDAGRRIRNAANCAVIYSHHTGKANARDRTTDQYSGRGGSALADGARMVHVLQRLQPEEWERGTGDNLTGHDSGFLLARPKMTWCPPQPDVYLKRRGFIFERIAGIDPTEGAAASLKKNADILWQYLRDQLEKGTKNTQRTLESQKVMKRDDLRAALHRLIADGRIVSESQGGGTRGGARTYLRPLDIPITT